MPVAARHIHTQVGQASASLSIYTSDEPSIQMTVNGMTIQFTIVGTVDQTYQAIAELFTEEE